MIGLNMLQVLRTITLHFVGIHDLVKLKVSATLQGSVKKIGLLKERICVKHQEDHIRALMF